MGSTCFKCQSADTKLESDVNVILNKKILRRLILFVAFLSPIQNSFQVVDVVDLIVHDQFLTTL